MSVDLKQKNKYLFQKWKNYNRQQMNSKGTQLVSLFRNSNSMHQHCFDRILSMWNERGVPSPSINIHALNQINLHEPIWQGILSNGTKKDYHDFILCTIAYCSHSEASCVTEMYLA
jgi:hypothetical protein